MFRGSARAKLDEKGRLKLPAAYLTPLLERFGAQLFITSMDGVSAQVYPLPVWLELEAKLAAPSGLLDPDLERFRMTVTFDEQTDGKTVLTMRQLHPSRERRQVVIGFGAVGYGLQTLDSLAAWLDG